MANSQPQIVIKPVSDIHPYGNNPRRNDAAVDSVAESIRRYGIKQPLVIDNQGVIVVGHTRYRAALKLGIKELPCIVSELSDEQNREYRLVDNKTNELAGWDFEKLELELETLDLSAFVFDFHMPNANLKNQTQNLKTMPLHNNGPCAIISSITHLCASCACAASAVAALKTQRVDKQGGNKHGSHLYETAPGSGRTLRPSNPPLEPQNGPVHLYRAQWHLHHRPAKNRSQG